MIRRAILIGHNDASASRNGVLHGVTKDIADLHAYLLSDHGGAWEDCEIGWHAAPRLAELRADLALAKTTCDYIFVAFSGHGAHDHQGSFVVLNDEEAIYVSELAQLGQKARRIVVLSDACRENVAVPVASPPKIASGDVAGIPDPAYRRSCRSGYDNAINNAAQGAVVMYSCSTGQTSGDSVQGGVFTQALLRSASQWAQAESDDHRVRMALYVRGAFGRVELPPQRRARPGVQTPRLSTANPPKFPFSVA